MSELERMDGYQRFFDNRNAFDWVEVTSGQTE